MNSYPGSYLLSMIDHKSEIVLAGIILTMRKDMQNNFRDRNPQLGRVEAVNEADNPLLLQVGDIVAVNHRTFYKAQVGPQGHRFQLQDHVDHDGIKLFRPLLEFIYFKYNNSLPELLPGNIICSGVKETDTLGFDTNTGEFLHKKEFAQEGVILVGNERYPDGKTVLVLKNAFYLVTLDRVDYFKVKESEIVSFIEDGEAIPAPSYFAVEYVEEVKEHVFLDLSYMSKGNNVTAKTDKGELIQVWRNQWVKYGNKWIINEDVVIWRWKYNEQCADLPLNERIEL